MNLTKVFYSHYMERSYNSVIGRRITQWVEDLNRHFLKIQTLKMDVNWCVILSVAREMQTKPQGPLNTH